MSERNSPVSHAASKLCAFLASPGASKGLLAELRKADPFAPSLGAMSCVLDHCDPDADAAEVSRWVAVAKAFVLADPKRHQADRSLGAALWATRTAEGRFTRLLNAPDDVLYEAVWRTCRLLNAKRQHFDFVELAQLLLWRSDELANEVRFRLARSYLRARSAAAQDAAAA